MTDAGKPVVDGARVMSVPGAQRPLVLTAHAAARAMIRRNLKIVLKGLLPRRTLSLRKYAWVRSVWTPLLLRWAGKVLAVWRGGSARAPALPARPISQYHWHFHLVAQLDSARARRQARTAAVTGPFQPHALAIRMSLPSADRMADTGYRPLRGPTGISEGAGALRVHPLAASIGRVRFAVPAERAVADAWQALPASRSERTVYRRRWLERAVADARWLRGEADGRRAELLPAPPVQSLRQTSAAGRNASADRLLTSTSLVFRWPIKATAALTSTRQSIYAQVQAGSAGFLPRMRSSGTRTFLRSKRESPANDAFASSSPSPGVLRSSEQRWRARDPAAAATAAATTTHFVRHTAAPYTASSLALRRPVDFVWLASRSSSAPSGDTPRFGTTSTEGAGFARSTQALAQELTAASRTGDNTVVRATALDPVLADRLVDDVIRRIDHRARIERERRGL